MAALLKNSVSAMSRGQFRCMSTARPMTRFIQYPFDKTKMEEVRAWANESSLPADIRGTGGVSDVEFSFCPGEG